MISTPLCRLDCDTHSDVSTAVTLSSAETVRDLRSKPIRLDAMSSTLQSSASWDQLDSPHMAIHDAARALWAKSDLKPVDVDVALLYDGFSFLTLSWLEALGFCGLGEDGAFVEGGSGSRWTAHCPSIPMAVSFRKVAPMASASSMRR